MTRAEWIEIAIIVAVGAINSLLSAHFSSAYPVWQIVLSLSALLLAQSLVRDVSILFRQQNSVSNEPRKEAQCMCLESTIGLTGVIAGLACLGLGSSKNMAVHPWEISFAMVGILAFGFAIKDLVISWNPFGIRREKDHLNLIVRLKRK